MNIVSVVVEPVAANQLKIYYQNYLESGTVTVTSENSSFPKYRLYDRAQGLLFKGTSHPNPFEIKTDIGPSGPYPGVDTIIIGNFHNLTGLTLTLKYSEDDGSYFTAKTWVAIAGINRQAFVEKSYRFWKLEIASPPANPELGELFLTKVLSFERNPNLGYGHGDEKNFNRLLSKAGMAQKTKWGGPKKAREYVLEKMSDSQRQEMEAFDAATDSIKNFYIEDLVSNLFFAELPEGLEKFRAEEGGRWGLNLRVLEVLD